MNRTYIESYYERYKDADFVADFIKEEIKSSYEWLKSRPDREKIVEEIVKCRVKFVKYLKIMDINAKYRPRMHVWQWILMERQAITNYISNGKCDFGYFETKNEPEIPVIEGFEDKIEYKEMYLSSVQTRYQWAFQVVEPNAIVRLVK